MEHQSVDGNSSFLIFLLGTLHRETQSVGDFSPIYSKTHNGTVADFLLSASCRVRQKFYILIFNDGGRGRIKLHSLACPAIR